MMKKMSWGWKLLVMTAVFAAIPLRQATAQGVGVLRGVVLDSVSQQPVAGAQVQLVGLIARWRLTPRACTRSPVFLRASDPPSPAYRLRASDRSR